MPTCLFGNSSSTGLWPLFSSLTWGVTVSSLWLPQQPPPAQTTETILLSRPAHLFYLSEDPQQVSTKDTLKLFLPPAVLQQLLYQYWVCGHVLQPLWEPVWPPASQPAIGLQTCSLVLGQNQSPMCLGFTEPQPWSAVRYGKWKPGESK